MATINHKTYNEATETFKDFNVYDGKETLIFKVDGEAGSVGIGTTSSSLFGTSGFGRVLGVVANSGYATVQIGGSSGYGGEVDFGAGSIRHGAVASLDGSHLGFYTNSTNSGDGVTERMRITSAGNVGIGTSSPQSILHISADKTLYTDYGVVFRGGTDNNNNYTGISLVSAGDGLGGIIGSNYLHDGSTASQSNSNRSSAYIRFANTTSAGQTSSIEIGGFAKGSTGDVTRLFISNTGNVGIGTASPSDKLHIYTGVNGGLQRWEGLGYTTFLGADGTGAYLYQNSSGRNFSIGSNSSRSQLVLDGGGNVGIGTDSPATNLEVKGNNAKIRITPSAQNNVQALEIGVNNSGVTQYAKIDVTNLVNYDTNIRFFTNSASSTTQVERLRILADGGITFNGDTAAANALDDYEEGTWTPTFVNTTFSGTVSATYTKIGRIVTAQLSFVNQTLSSSSGTASISGLPFVCNASTYGLANFSFTDSLADSVASGYVSLVGTVIQIRANTSTGSTSFVDGTSNKSMMLNVTYYV